MSKAFDIGSVLTPTQLAQVKQDTNAEAIIPYLDPFNPKGCTAQYLRDIYAAGLSVAGFFWETTGGAGQGDSYFTYAQGIVDCRFAEQLLAGFKAEGLIGDGTFVWYADDVRLQNVSRFDDYANAIENTATAIQKPRIYGFEDLIRYAQEPAGGRLHRYPNMGPEAFLTYGDPTGLLLAGWQHEQVSPSGITVDISEVYVAGWRPQEEDMATPQELWDNGLAAIVQAKVVAPQEDTNKALKAGLAALQSPDTLSDAQIKKIATVLGLMLQAEGAK